MQKRLYRSQKDQVVAGVCGGIGEYFGIDPTFVRLLWIISIFPFRIGIALYIIAAIIIPKREEDGAIDPEETNQDTASNQEGSMSKARLGRFLGFGLIIIGTFLILERLEIFRWIDSQIILPVLLILGGIVILRNAFKK